MKKLHELYEKLEKSSISLLASRPGGKKPELLSDMILYYGLNKKRSVTVYTTEPKFWFHNHLLAHLNKTTTYDIEKYLYPCIYNYGEYDINKDALLENIETLRKSRITIEGLERIIDYTDYIMENEAKNRSDVVIICEVEPLLTNNYHYPKEVLDAIKKMSKNTQIILVSGVNRSAEVKAEYSFEEIHYYREIEPYIDEIMLLHIERPHSSKERNIMIETKESSIEITYDEETDQFHEN